MKRQIRHIRDRYSKRFAAWRHELAAKIRGSKRERDRKIKAIHKAIHKAAKPHGLSEKGAAFIARFEGFRSAPYRDAVGVWTIGYGHTGGVSAGTKPVSQKEALVLLEQDAATAAKAVESDVKVKLGQAQLDALISFTFNVGVGAFGSSTLLRLLNGGDYESVPDQLMRWTHGGSQVLPGLVTRRKAEGALFAHGTYH